MNFPYSLMCFYIYEMAMSKYDIADDDEKNRNEKKHCRRKWVTHHKGVSDVERPTYKEMRIVSLKSS